jgi:hypothetical protein
MRGVKTASLTMESRLKPTEFYRVRFNGLSTTSEVVLTPRGGMPYALIEF